MPRSGDSSIAEMLNRARAGDRHELSRLFEACRSYLALIARTQVERTLQSKVDASDIVQDTLLEAHRDFVRFQGTTAGEWLAWLRGILSHNAADVVRQYRGTEKRQTRRELQLQKPDDSAIGFFEPADPAESPSEQIIQRERELAVADAISRLSPDHQEVIVLRNLERLPFDQVASRMGRSRPAVQMLWMRAIRKLQESLVESNASQSTS